MTRFRRRGGPSMYGCCGAETGRPTDRPASPSSRPGPAARLILNIDHVYSTQPDSLVITISTSERAGDGATRPTGLVHRAPPFLPASPAVPALGRSTTGRSVTLYRTARLGSVVARRWFVCNFIKWVSVVGVEFDESLKLTGDARTDGRAVHAHA